MSVNQLCALWCRRSWEGFFVFGRGSGGDFVHCEIGGRSNYDDDEAYEEDEHEDELDDPEGNEDPFEPWCWAFGCGFRHFLFLFIMIATVQ